MHVQSCNFAYLNLMFFQLSSLLTLKLSRLSRVFVSVHLKIKPAIPFLISLALDLLT